MSDDFKIVLRAWYRFVATDFWRDVQRSSLLVVRSPQVGFMLDAFYDPGPVTDREYEPTVVFRGYLVDVPPPGVLDIFLGKRERAQNSLQGSYDGLGTLPREYANYLRSKAAHISKLSTDAYDLLLWRHKILDGPPSLTIEPTSLFWAELSSGWRSVISDELNWHQVPSGVHMLDFPPGEPLDLRPEVGHRLTELLEARAQAPLGHVLFREAWRLRKSNLRSALVMGIAAAETGVKEFIRNAAPETSWLIENLQSPPLDMLLKDYLPMLPSKADARQTVPPLPKEWRSTFCGAVKARNKVVHGRTVDLDSDQIEATLNSVRDFLYFLDYHAGCDWAAPVGFQKT